MALRDLVAGYLENSLSGTTPEQYNPAFGAKEMKPQDYLDHLNDQLSSNGSDPYTNVDDAIADGQDVPTNSKWFDKNGNDVTKYATDKTFGTTNPMMTPSMWQKIVNPSAANKETAYNTEYNIKPGLAQQAHDINLGLNTQDTSEIPKEFNPANYTPRQLAIMGEAGMNPTQLSGQAVSSLNARRGGPALDSSADILGKYKNLSNADFDLDQLSSVQKYKSNLNKLNLQDSEGDLGRETDKQATLNQEQMNSLARVTGVDPQQIQLAHDELAAQIHRNPDAEETREYILKKQKAMAFQALSDSDIANRQSHNQELNALFQSEHQPIGSSPLTRAPNGSLQLDKTWVPGSALASAGYTGKTEGLSKYINASNGGMNLNPSDNQIHTIGSNAHVMLPTTPSVNSDKAPVKPQAMSPVAIPAKSSLSSYDYDAKGIPQALIDYLHSKSVDPKVNAAITKLLIGEQ